MYRDTSYNFSNEGLTHLRYKYRTLQNEAWFILNSLQINIITFNTSLIAAADNSIAYSMSLK